MLRGLLSGKKEYKLKLLGPDMFRWGGARGGLPRQGGKGQKIPHVLRNPGKTDFWVGYPGMFAGMPRAPGKFERKHVCSILVPFSQGTFTPCVAFVALGAYASVCRRGMGEQALA